MNQENKRRSGFRCFATKDVFLEHVAEDPGDCDLVTGDCTLPDGEAIPPLAIATIVTVGLGWTIVCYVLTYMCCKKDREMRFALRKIMSWANEVIYEFGFWGVFLYGTFVEDSPTATDGPIGELAGVNCFAANVLIIALLSTAKAGLLAAWYFANKVRLSADGSKESVQLQSRSQAGSDAGPGHKLKTARSLIIGIIDDVVGIARALFLIESYGDKYIRKGSCSTTGSEISWCRLNSFSVVVSSLCWSGLLLCYKIYDYRKRHVLN
jgi:hypothetical protein